jgi:alpha-L-arabinofuranosidase
VLTHSDMRARNTFEHPDEVRLSPLPITVDRDRVLVEIPKQAVVALEVTLN